MPEVVLNGCRLTPLASYLKALGVIRLVAEQADRRVGAEWRGEELVIESSLSADDLVDFFADRYRPTPLISPWNGGSGFGPKDKAESFALVRGSQLERLADYRQAITVAKQISDEAAEQGWDKAQQLTAYRSWLPDSSVDWVDAAVALTADKPVFSPILGTGGNDGRLEFSKNFMDCLVRILDLDVRKRRSARSETPTQWLRGALFDEPSRGIDTPIGQYNAGAAGGPDAGPTGGAPGVVNPWDYVLLFEGALMFAGGAAKRLRSTTVGKAALPFIVDGSPVAYGSSSSAEDSRGEVWTPVWRNRAGYHELRRLFMEARSEWRGAQARSGLDMAKSIGTLGVDRGITAFVRHGLVKRNGLAFTAVEVGRVEVARRPGAPLLAELDRWLQRIRYQSNPSNSVTQALRAVDEASYQVAIAGEEQLAERALTLLIAAAELDTAIGRSGEAKANSRPLELPGRPWVEAIVGTATTDEHLLGLALASGRDQRERGDVVFGDALRPVKRDRDGRATWVDSPLIPGVTGRDLYELIADVYRRRIVDSADGTERWAVEEVVRGVHLPFQRSVRVPLQISVDFYSGRLDLEQVRLAMRAGMVLDWKGADFSIPRRDWPFVDRRLAILLPFCQRWRPHSGESAVSREPWNAGASWVPRLMAGHVDAVVSEALGRLRLYGWVPLLRSLPDQPETGIGLRMAAALPTRLHEGDVAHVLNGVARDTSEKTIAGNQQTQGVLQ